MRLRGSGKGVFIVNPDDAVAKSRRPGQIGRLDRFAAAG